ncbi:Otoancorin [Manis pentadactyla]|nr:Otoancorin [Manis pentadactyla]
MKGKRQAGRGLVHSRCSETVIISQSRTPQPESKSPALTRELSAISVLTIALSLAPCSLSGVLVDPGLSPKGAGTPLKGIICCTVASDLHFRKINQQAEWPVEGGVVQGVPSPVLPRSLLRPSSLELPPSQPIPATTYPSWTHPRACGASEELLSSSLLKFLAK